MSEERALRAELETLQHDARGLREELALEHAPSFLARRDAIQRALSKGERALAATERPLKEAQAGNALLADQVAQARSALARAEQQELAPSLVVIPFVALGLSVPFILETATAASAWPMGGLAGLLLGTLLGFAFARPADEPAPLVPTLGQDLFGNPAAWALLALVPAWGAAGASLSASGWMGGNPFPWLRLPLDGLAVALATLALALAARRRTQAGLLALVFAMGTIVVLTLSGNATLSAPLPPGSPRWASQAAHFAVFLPVISGGFLLTAAFSSRRRVALTLAVVAGLLSAGASAQLAGRKSGGGAAFLVTEQLAFRSAASALLSAERMAGGNEGLAGYYRRHPEEGIDPDEFLAQSRLQLEQTRGKAAATVARLSSDVALLTLSLQLAMLSLLAAWAPRGVSRWARVAALLPLGLLLAALLRHP